VDTLDLTNAPPVNLEAWLVGTQKFQHTLCISDIALRAVNVVDRPLLDFFGNEFFYFETVQNTIFWATGV
jgi:hypothetical protein